MSKKRHAFVGTGGRALSFIEPLVTTHGDRNELVAICDTSAARMRYYNELLVRDIGHPAVPAYGADRFDDMLREQKPDEVFVCTQDSTHHDYIIRALRAGCDVITEKPMTTDADKCTAVLDAVKTTGKRLRVAFNYRWAPFRSKVKELIDSGVVGRIRERARVWLRRKGQLDERPNEAAEQSAIDACAELASRDHGRAGGGADDGPARS